MEKPIPVMSRHDLKDILPGNALVNLIYDIRQKRGNETDNDSRAAGEAINQIKAC